MASEDAQTAAVVDQRGRSCRQAALVLLARREYTRRELRQKLARRFPADEIERSLQDLADQELQCDHRFACAFTRERVRRGYGPQRVLAELQHRGVSSEVAEAALSETTQLESWNWRQLARVALKRKFGHTDLPGDVTQRAKALRYLHYRGFSTQGIDNDDTGDPY